MDIDGVKPCDGPNLIQLAENALPVILYGNDNPITLAKALEIAKEIHNGQCPTAIKVKLENEINKTWERIRVNPKTYIMTKEEFALFNYYRARYDSNPLAQQAVARFWNHYKGETPWSENGTSMDTLEAPPPGFLTSGERSSLWQDSLQDYCQASGRSLPRYELLSDRRGKRTAWSCAVFMGAEKVYARYWYDGHYTNTAQEDAAEEALHQVKGTPKTTRFQRNAGDTVLANFGVERSFNKGSRPQKLRSVPLSLSAIHNSSIAAEGSSRRLQSVEEETIFIEKLYHFLEDPSVGNRVWWSASKESFFMAPSADFSEIISRYFNYTDESSFIKQLTIFGFQKVSDFSLGGSPEAVLWEFRQKDGKFTKKDPANAGDDSGIDSSDTSSGNLSEEKDAFDFGWPDKLQTFFDPDTGEAYVLTPRTSIHSDGGQSEIGDLPDDGAMGRTESRSEELAGIQRSADANKPTGGTASAEKCMITGDLYNETTESLPVTVTDVDLIPTEDHGGTNVHSVSKSSKTVSFAPVTENSRTRMASELTDFGSSSEEEEGEGDGWETDNSSIDGFADLAVSNKLGVKDLTRPLVLPGYSRLTWKCKCGEELYSDIKGQDGLKNLGRSHVHSSKQEVARQPSAMVNSGSETKWISFCINAGTIVNSTELDVTYCKTDEDFFQMLRDEYTARRQPSSLWTWFKEPAKMELIQFEIGKGDSVENIKSPLALPKRELRIRGYEYTRKEEFRPVPDHVLTHLFKYPHPRRGRSVWLDRIPKRVKNLSQDVRKQDGGSGEASVRWGLLVVERPSIKAYLFSWLTLSLILSVVCSIALASKWEISFGPKRLGIRAGSATLAALILLITELLPALRINGPQVGGTQSPDASAFDIPLMLGTMLGTALFYILGRLQILWTIISRQSIGVSPAISPEGVHILQGEEYSIVNSVKIYVETLTEVPWNWWPLSPSFRELLPGDARIRWRCKSGHSHWSIVSREKLSPGKRSVKTRQCRRSSALGLQGFSCSNFEVPKGSDNPLNENGSESPDSQSSTDPSSSATSDNGSTSQSPSGPSLGKDQSFQQEIIPPNPDNVVEIFPLSELKGFVLFGVRGSRHMQSSRTSLAQIDVEIHCDDDKFFQELVVQYKHLRGFFRWIFSIWVFDSCAFSNFYKANPGDIILGPGELPPATDTSYSFDTLRHPSILGDLIRTAFHGCKRPCLISQLDKFEIFHACKGRDPRGKFRILELLPKRRHEWEIDEDGGTQEAWGLNATFAISAYKVMLYQFLFCVGPIIFWGLWLKQWPRDWQNASVPLFAMVALSSMFYRPLIYNLEAKARGKLKAE